jgi:hypothetical protein
VYLWRQTFIQNCVWKELVSSGAVAICGYLRRTITDKLRLVARLVMMRLMQEAPARGFKVLASSSLRALWFLSSTRTVISMTYRCQRKAPCFCLLFSRGRRAFCLPVGTKCRLFLRTRTCTGTVVALPPLPLTTMGCGRTSRLVLLKSLINE